MLVMGNNTSVTNRASEKNKLSTSYIAHCLGALQLVVLFLCGSVQAAAAAPPSQPEPAIAVCQQQTLKIFAAASLQAALTDLIEKAADFSECKPVLVIAASGILARQIKAGAPADLFLSANRSWVDHVRGDRGVYPLVKNRLALVHMSKPMAWSKESLRPYLDSNPLVIADPATAPLGRASLDALVQLFGKSLDAGELALATNALTARILAERGGLAAILYESEAARLEGPRTRALIPGTEVDYFAVNLATGARGDIVNAFVSFLMDAAQAPTWHHHTFRAVSK